VLLPTSHDVRILEKPSWLTPRRLLVSLAIVLAVLLVAISWSVMVAKRNSILKSVVREKKPPSTNCSKPTISLRNGSKSGLLS